MTPRTELLNLLRNQLEIEIKSRDLYTRFLGEIDKADFKKTINKIEQDEEKHIKIVKELIQIVEDYGIIKEKKIKKEFKEKDEGEVKTNKVISQANSIFFLTDLETYMYKIKRILKENLKEPSKKAVYVSYNKLPKYTKKMFDEYKINSNQIIFINCVGVSFGEDISINPQDLTKLAITINNTVVDMKNPLVVIDTVSAFSVYHNIDLISKFVSSMNDSARRKSYTLLWVALKSEGGADLNSKLASFCDTVINK
jgi:rubrerythrin